MASSTVPTFLVFVFLAFGGFALLGMSGLPPWLMAPLMQWRNAGRTPLRDTPDMDKPESVLLERLKYIDANREPEAALSLHAALGKLLRASGAPSSRVIEHLTLARDLAVRGHDSDATLAARLDLAEALLEAGRPWDSQHELVMANEVLPDHFVENRVKLIRLHGRARFELGEHDSALTYLRDAEVVAGQQHEKVSVALDIGTLHTCRGDVSASLEVLQKALDILHKSRKLGPDGGMPVPVHDALALQVYFRLGEAYHFKRDFIMAKAHFEKALYFDKKSPGVVPKYASAIKEDLLHLEHGIGPELHCPSVRKAPWDTTRSAVEVAEAQDASTKISLLISKKEYNKAEALLSKDLKKHPRPYKNLDAAQTLNQLGKLYNMEHRRNIPKAAKHFRLGLLAALACASRDEALIAYEGLKSVKDLLPSHERAVAMATMNHYLDAAKKEYRLSLQKGASETKTAQLDNSMIVAES